MNIFYDDAILEWLGDKSEHTQRAYRRHVDDLCAYLDMNESHWYTRVSYLDLVNWRKHVLRNATKSTQPSRIAAIRSLFKFLAQCQYIPKNPSHQLRVPKRNRASKQIRYLTPKQVKRAFQAATGPVEVGLLAACYYGMLRRNEVCQLTKKDCSFVIQKGKKLLKLHIYGKGRDVKERDIVMGVNGTRLLKPLVVGTRGHLFVGMRGPLSCSGIYRCIKKVLTKADLTYASPHWLRHAGASHAYTNGALLTAVRDMLGHADIKVTSKYLHTDPSTNTPSRALDKF